MVASDYSTDRTNELVEGFIKENPELNIILYKAKDHKVMNYITFINYKKAFISKICSKRQSSKRK